MRRRLRWLPDMTAVSEISNDGRSATRAVGYERQPWTASGLLPMAGKSSWSVCVDQVLDERGLIDIGVCDAAGRHGWGLCVAKGKVILVGVDANGQYIYSPTPPAGWPSGESGYVSTSPDGTEAGVVGAVIEVGFDHDRGALSICVDGGPLHTLSGFPRGASLRAWVRLWGHNKDGVVARPTVPVTRIGRMPSRGPLRASRWRIAGAIAALRGVENAMATCVQVSPPRQGRGPRASSDALAPTRATSAVNTAVSAV